MRVFWIAVAILALSLSWSVAAHPRSGDLPPRIVFVNDDAPGGGPGDGESWETAYTALAIALAAEPGPAEFWLAAGVYRPAGFSGRFARLVIGPGQHLFGGFAGTET